MRCLTTVAILAVAFATPVHAQELSGTLKKIKETGAITLGIRDSAVPFSYIDDKQKIVGYAVDICMKIVDEIKAELKLDKLEVNQNIVTSSTRIPLMANGTVDLECGSTTNNADRQKQVWFTNTHFLTASRFVSKKALKLDQVDDLKGKAVVSVSGTTNITQLNKANAARSLGITVMNAKDVPEAFLMVETDRAAGIRHGRHPACGDDRLLEGPVALCDQQRRFLRSGALWHHAAQGRCAVQNRRRSGNRQALQEPRNRDDLQQMVHGAGAAARPELPRADASLAQEVVRAPVRQSRSRILRGMTTT